MKRAAVALAFALLASPAAPARAAGRAPVLEKFTARFNAATTTTEYSAVAADPDGGPLGYAWSLRAGCGFLLSPKATGPTNGYQHGPPALPPDGCPSATSRAAVVTVTISDREGCAIAYTQPARDETVHARPKVVGGPCPPVAAKPTGGGISTGLILLLIVLVVAAAAFGLLRARSRPQPPAGATRRGRPAAAPSPVAEGEAPAPAPVCAEGEVRNEVTRAVAHETVTAGPVVIVATMPGGAQRQIEVDVAASPAPSGILTRLGLDSIEQIDASIPLRLSTISCTTREVCRDGGWVVESEVDSAEGAVRTEQLRTRSHDRGEIERFVAETLARRVSTLAEARARLDAAETRCRATDRRLS